jgi:hypothetical protein
VKHAELYRKRLEELRLGLDLAQLGRQLFNHNTIGSTSLNDEVGAMQARPPYLCDRLTVMHAHIDEDCHLVPTRMV